MRQIAITPANWAQPPAFVAANHLHRHGEKYLFSGHVGYFNSILGIEANLHLVRGNLEFLFLGDRLRRPVEKVKITAYWNLHGSQAAVAIELESGGEVSEQPDLLAQEFRRRFELDRGCLPEVGALKVQRPRFMALGYGEPVKF